MRHVAAALALLAAGCVERALEIPDDAGQVDGAEQADGAQPQSFHLLAPLSTSTVTTHRPTLRWIDGPADAVAELCADRACAAPTPVPSVTASSARPTELLGLGVHFWRVRGGGTTSATWELFVGARDAALDNSYGTLVDLDGDGAPEVGVTALGVGGDPAALFLYAGSAQGISSTPSVTIPGVEALMDYSDDWSVASAGDLNGDGYGDLAVGSINLIESMGVPGHVRIYYGSAAGIRPDEAQLLVGPAESFEFGRTVGGAGDFNGDGYGDVIISDYDEVVGVGQTGRVYLFLGGSGGLGAPIPIDSSDEQFEAFGWTIAAADLDGDGYTDAVISRGVGSDIVAYSGGPAGLTSPRVVSIASSSGALANVSYVGTVSGGDAILIGDIANTTLPPEAWLWSPDRGDPAPLAVTGAWLSAAGVDADRDGLDDVFLGLVPTLVVIPGGASGVVPANTTTVQSPLSGAFFAYAIAGRR